MKEEFQICRISALELRMNMKLKPILATKEQVWKQSGLWQKFNLLDGNFQSLVIGAGGCEKYHLLFPWTYIYW